jgi:hypothetical protein
MGMHRARGCSPSIWNREAAASCSCTDAALGFAKVVHDGLPPQHMSPQRRHHRNCDTQPENTPTKIPYKVYLNV